MSAVADKLTAGLPAALRGAVADWADQFAARHGESALSPRLVALAAASEFAGKTLLSQWPAFAARGSDPLAVPAQDDLERFATSLEDADIDSAKRELRRYRDRYLTAVIARELESPERFRDNLADWSHFASVMLDVATRLGSRQVERRFGRLLAASGEPVPFVILGMGKLGGGELNFSSDIDIVFLYSGDGQSDGRKSVTAETWVTRLSQQIVSLIDETTADGFVFRVDTRLRPFGDSGPPVSSFAALENYLLAHGRTWERYAYIKAAVVGPAVSDAVREALFDRLITPFVYRQYLDYGVFESLRDMHAMITAEVERRELADNLKLGPGGIREIEFIVQSLQLIRAGSRPALATPSLLDALPRLADDRALSADDCRRLEDAYVLLRRVENVVQGIRDRQTHDIPGDAVDRARLCFALGVDDWPQLEARLAEARAVVREYFAGIAFGNAEPPAGEDGPFAQLWRAPADRDAIDEAFPRADRALDEAAARLEAFRSDPATARADKAAQRRLDHLMPSLLTHVLATDDPATTLDRVLGIVSAVLRRSAYLSLLIENPEAAARLVELCSQSRYIADELASYPVLLDELLDPRVSGEGLSRHDLDSALRARLADEPADDVEAMLEALVQYQRATMFRIAVADFNGTLPLMKVSDTLTWLAEAVLDAALGIAWEELTSRHGVPAFDEDGRTVTAGFGIVAYGKLGGLELSYGSDLDIVFLNDSRGTEQQTTGDRPLDNAVFFGRLARRLIHFLTIQTRSGVLYEIDTRLRPSGRKGLLVTTVDAFERYQAHDAWTWEHQALLRARAVAGSDAIGRRFATIRREILANAVRRDRLREDVVSMRRKMRSELDRSTPELFDLKHGEGGLGDIEFLVQYLVLHEAARVPALLEHTDNIRQLDALRDQAILEAPIANRLQDVYRDFRRHQHRLSLNDEPALLPRPAVAAGVRVVRAAWLRHLGDG